MDLSEHMRRIRSKHTKPELSIRRLVSALGYRYRLHRKNLPGSPDLVFAGRSKVIFVHGCFWHQHTGCRLAHLPKSNLEYWLPKLARNRARDTQAKRALSRLGWRYLVVWECQTREGALERRLLHFLES